MLLNLTDPTIFSRRGRRFNPLPASVAVGKERESEQKLPIFLAELCIRTPRKIKVRVPSIYQLTSESIMTYRTKGKPRIEAGPAIMT